jgi:putative hydrolase of the HAD superfamily
MAKKYELLLLDAANTVIHKPKLWSNFIAVLDKYGFKVEEIELRRKHKTLSEIIHFPDQTSQDFYQTFNKEVLLALGIVPTDEMLTDIFKACTYLPWEAFDDALALKDLDIKKAILSNFNSTLSSKLEDIFGAIFHQIITSEVERVGKPNVLFYRRAIELLDIDPGKILYVGDSLKLDVIPALSVGMNAILVDRDGNFPYSKNSISSFNELTSLI